MIVYGGNVVLVGLGIVIWGLGASLGFPVGMSAAADDPLRAARRVSAVSTIGYTAFLAGPPLLGLLADHIGTLETLLVIAGLMVPAAVTVFAPATCESARDESRVRLMTVPAGGTTRPPIRSADRSGRGPGPFNPPKRPVPRPTGDCRRDRYRSPPGTQSTSPCSRLACRARMNSRSESRLR